MMVRDTAGDGNAGKGEVKGAVGEERAAAHVSWSEPLVVNEVCYPRKDVRNLRDRNPIQLRPYALEREVYRQRVKRGRVE